MTTLLHRALLLLALFALSLGSAPALACSCEPQTVEQAKQDAVAIFEGRVTSITRAPDSDPELPELIVSFEVARSWRGLQEQSTVAVRTAESGVSCGYAFTQGSRYLVYAAGAPARLEVHNCGRTQPLSEAGQDLSALGEGVTPGKREPTRGAAPAQSKLAGCASTSASSSTSASAPPLFWCGASLLALFAKRGRRRR